MRNRECIDLLASRIERAYRRRNPGWVGLGPDEIVWSRAASRLMDASGDLVGLPIDPELFVAVLAPGGISPDPWTELTQPSSQTRYGKALRSLIGGLRRELSTELRLGECRLAGGKSLDDLLDDNGDRISALARYILAFRAARFDLLIKHRAAAREQHNSCPLYRDASRKFLPDHAYPEPESDGDPTFGGRKVSQFSLN